MKLIICMPLLATMSLTACATITRGSTETVAFTSSPQGANVSTTTGVRCTTPCEAIVKRRGDFAATFTQNGRAKTVNVDGGISGAGVATAIIGNAIIGGVIGLAIDIGTGAMNDHTPNPVHANFDGSNNTSQTPVVYSATQCAKGSPPMVGGSSYCY